MRKIVIKSALLVALITPVSLAHASKLNGNEITSLISGKRVVLSTTWGAFPLRYQSSKRVVGDGSALGLAKFFSPKETGKWWVASNRLCQKFPTWYKGRSFCFSIEKTGPNKIKWTRQDGYSGSATISK